MLLDRMDATGRERRVSIRLKRIYEEPDSRDGYRVLVDRLWPRGVSKEEANIDEWLKEIAPSDELRQWFDHDAQRWAEFRRRYLTELTHHRELLRPLTRRATKAPVTLLFGAKDTEHNNAVVIKQYLKMLDAS